MNNGAKFAELRLMKRTGWDTAADALGAAGCETLEIT